MDAWLNILDFVLGYVMSSLIIALEFASFILFSDAFFTRRVGKKYFWILVLLFFFISFAVINILNTAISSLKVFFGLLSFSIISFILYKGQWLTQIVIATLWYALNYLAGYVWDLAVTMLVGITFQEYVYSIALYSVSITARALFQLFLTGLFRRFHKPNNMKNSHWELALLLFPLASLFLLISLVALSEDSPRTTPLVFGCVCTLMVGDLGILILIDLMEKRTQDREQTLSMNLRIQSQAEGIEALSAAYSAQRKMTHDFQHHLATLSTLMDENTSPEAARYLHELQAQQTERIFLVNTHHATIDAVLNQKAFAAKKLGIDIRFDVNDLSPLKINPVDCTTVLANLLDNALEACEKLKPEQRWIEVQVLHDKAALPVESILFVSIRNASPPVKIVYDEIATTKPDPSMHGFGLPNVKALLARHHAEYVMNYNDGVFQFTLEWPDTED